MYAKYGAAAVVFEVGRLSAKGGHAHVQSVPIPLRLKDKVEETFVNEGRALGIDFETDPEAALDSCLNGRGSYFKVELPDGRKMVHLLKDNVPFSIQFGRYVGIISIHIVSFNQVIHGFFRNLGRPWSLYWVHLIDWIGRHVCCLKTKIKQMPRLSRQLLCLSILRLNVFKS
jgi:hypothetical protein